MKERSEQKVISEQGLHVTVPLRTWQCRALRMNPSCKHKGNGSDREVIHAPSTMAATVQLSRGQATPQTRSLHEFMCIFLHKEIYLSLIFSTLINFSGKKKDNFFLVKKKKATGLRF